MAGKGHAALFYLLLAALAVVPFTVGMHGWAWAHFATAIFLLLTAWGLMQALRRAPMPGALHDYRRLFQLAAVVLAYHLLKALPIWPGWLVAWLSPQAWDIYQFTDLGIPRFGYALSLDSGLALREFLRLASFFALLFLVLVLVRTRKQASTLAHVLVLVIFAVGLWGLVEFLWQQHGRGRASGLFGNANYFAGFLEMGLGLAAGLWFARQDRQRHSAWRTRLVGLIDWIMSLRANLVLVLVVLLAALFASGSRGGTLAFVVALLGALVLLVKGRESSPRSRRFVLSLVLIGVTSMVWLGADALLSRIGPGQQDQAARISYWESGMQMVRDFPLFGIGAGSWRYAYDLYRDPELPAHTLPLHAHNDHVQMLAEHGVIGYLVMGAFVLTALGMLVRALRRRRDRFVRGYVFGALVSTGALLLHGFADNNLQIMVPTVYFFAILALGLAVARLPSARERSSST